MSLTSQVFLQPGSVARSLDEHHRKGRIANTDGIYNFTLTAPTDVLVLARADIAGANTFPAYRLPTLATGSALTDADLKLLGDSPAIAGATIPDADFGSASDTAVAIDALFNTIRVELKEASNRDQVLVADIDGDLQRVYALAQIKESQQTGDLLGQAGAESFQYTFAIFQGNQFLAVEIPAGDYLIGFPHFYQERLTPRVLFDSNAIAADPAQFQMNLERDEVRVLVNQLIEAGQPIDITGSAANTTVSLPSGQGFDLSQFASAAEFDAATALSVHVGGQLAVKGPVGSYLPTAPSPQPTSETWIERLDANNVAASVDLWPGTMVRFIGPRSTSGSGSGSSSGSSSGSGSGSGTTTATSTQPFSRILFNSGQPFTPYSGTTSVTVEYTGSNPLGLSVDKAGGSSPTSIISSGQQVSVSFDGTESLSALELSFSGTSADVVATRERITALDFTSTPAGFVQSQTANGSTTFNLGNLGSQFPNLERISADSNTIFAVKFEDLPTSLQSIELSNGMISVFEDGTSLNNPSTYSAIGLRFLENLVNLNLQNNNLNAFFIDMLLTEISEPSSLVRNAGVVLTGNPGAGSVNLSNYPNLTAYNITVFL